MCINPIKIVVNKEEYTVPCGKCFSCRKKQSNDWAVKLICENEYHIKKCFVTLTFDNNILKNGNKYGANLSFIYHIENSNDYFKKFMKRLRKHYKNKAITYFRVSEYGDKTKRPHIHMIIWGINFEEDRIQYTQSKSNHIQYYSPTLQKLWNCGICTIQDINIYNTIYTSQYVNKKFKKDEKRYKAKISFSNRSKISSKWARRNFNEIAKGNLEIDKKKFSIPKSYKKTLKESDRKEHKEAFRQYEEKINQYLLKENNKERINHEKIKEQIFLIRNKTMNKIRDI